MKQIQGVQLMEGSNEELLPGFSAEFPYIASCVEFDRYGETAVPWHWHRAVELFYMKSGALEYTTPNGKWVFPAGSGGLVNSNVLHISRVLPSDDDRPQQWIHLFEADFLAGVRAGRIETRYILPMTAASGIELLPLYPDDPRQAKILEDLRNSFALPEQEWGYEFRLREALSGIWLQLLEQIPSVAPSVAKVREADEKIKMLMVYIHEHYRENISVDELADTAHISRRACFRLFQDNLHMTPVEYIRNYRLQKACYLLAESDQSVTQIAYSCGLGSSSYFGKVFREQTGSSPLEYRRHRIRHDMGEK